MLLAAGQITIFLWLTLFFSVLATHDWPARTESPEPVCTFIPPQNPGASCGSAGTLKHPNPANDPTVVRNKHACQELCARHKNPFPHESAADPDSQGCISFGYDTSSGVCNIYSESLAHQGFQADSSSSTVFYGVHCYLCSPQCPQQYGKERLDNGGFEDSTEFLGPWNSGGKGIVTSPGHNSLNAYLCSNKTDCTIFQTVQNCPGHVYFLSLDYKIASAKNQQSTLRVIASSMSYLTFTRIKPWTTLELWFTTDSHTMNELVIDFFPNTGTGGSDYYLDNVILHRVSENFETQPGSLEYVKNGDFETGDIAPWTAHRFGRNKFSIASPGIASKYALEFQGTVSDRDGENTLTQTLLLTAGKRYLLQYNGKKIKSQASYPDIFIGDILYEAPYPTKQKNTYNFSLPFQAQSDTVRIQMIFQYGPLLIDNVSVKALKGGT